MKTQIKHTLPQKNRNMNLNRLLAKREVLLCLSISIDIFFYLCITYVANFLKHGIALVTGKIPSAGFLQYTDLHYAFSFTGKYALLYYFFFIVFILAVDIKLWYKFKISYSEEYFNIGQKGIARATTPEEIKTQYKAIPEKNKFYAGKTGTIMAHFNSQIYIDENINNTLIIGITRSGKGEMYIYKTIDICSRAEEKPSIIVNDPKMENYKSSKATLEHRGYEVHLLNFDDPLHSMGINPLAIIIEMYKQNEKAIAYALARTLSYSIFHADDNGKSEPIWSNTATDLFTALIIAIIEDLLMLDAALNEMRIHAYRVKVNKFKNLDEEEKKNVRDEVENAVANGEDVVACPSITAIPEDIPFTYSHKHEKQISIYNIIIFFTELVRVKDPENPSVSKLDLYFQKRSPSDLAKLKFATVESASERTKGSVYTNMLSYLGVFIDENIAKMTAESSIRMADVGFGDKPIAIFLGIPDYDKSTHFIPAIFIRQLYFVLAKKATNKPGQKCKRPVKFILDEFGNMPPIEAMEEIITVSNGRNISFDLYVQSYAQIHKQYGDNAQTIIDNCANEVYIKSGDDETLEKISKMLGTETYIDVQRTGSKLSINKTYMETPSDKPLLRPEELQNLKEGECVVIRKLKRKDNKGNDIVPTPILNLKRYGMEFLYRYMYLTDTFPDPDTINLKAINNESREHIDLQERLINVDEIFNGIDEQIGMTPEITLYCQCKNFHMIDEKLRDTIGNNYMDLLEIQRQSPLALVIDKIENTARLKESTKYAILSLAE